jgi:hypothetical protein
MFPTAGYIVPAASTSWFGRSDLRVSCPTFALLRPTCRRDGARGYGGYAWDVAKKNSKRLRTEEEREVREAEQRLDTLLRVAEQAHAEEQLDEVIRDMPGVREQLQSFLDA